jgi:hypothetical protein
MVNTGTAFRPPRQTNAEAWQLAEKLIAAGYPFHSTGRRLARPRRLSDLPRWLEERTRQPSAGPEKKISITIGAAGTITVRHGRRALKNDDQVLLWHQRDWREGRVQFPYRDGKPWSRPLVIVPSLKKNFVLSARTRLRVIANPRR